jgi:hypothetical protein
MVHRSRDSFLLSVRAAKAGRQKLKSDLTLRIGQAAFGFGA